MLTTPPSEPTPRELEILRVLWDRGPSTVREVHEIMGGAAGTQRTTILKLLQIMREKGLVVRDDDASPQVYAAAWQREVVERKLLRGFINRVFGGSSRSLMVRALDSTSASELEEIRRLIEDAEGGQEEE